MMKSVLLLIISLFFVGCNSDEPKLGAIGSISSNSTHLPYITNVSVLTSPYTSPLKKAVFTGTEKIQFPALTLNYVVMVIDTTGTPAGPLFETDSGTPVELLGLSSGTISSTNCMTGPFCTSRDEFNVWNNVDQTTPTVTTYLLNTIKIIAVKFPSNTNNYRIGGFIGGVHEMYFLNSATPLVIEPKITTLIEHLETKYNVSY